MLTGKWQLDLAISSYESQKPVKNHSGQFETSFSPVKNYSLKIGVLSANCYL